VPVIAAGALMAGAGVLGWFLASQGTLRPVSSRFRRQMFQTTSYRITRAEPRPAWSRVLAAIELALLIVVAGGLMAAVAFAAGHTLLALFRHVHPG
jgi:hypothetical protein